MAKTLEQLANETKQFVNAGNSLQNNREYQIYQDIIRTSPDAWTQERNEKRYAENLSVRSGKEMGKRLLESQQKILETISKNYSTIIAEMSDEELIQRAYQLSQRGNDVQNLRKATSGEKPDFKTIQAMMDKKYGNTPYYSNLIYSPEEMLSWVEMQLQRDLKKFVQEKISNRQGNDVQLDRKKAEDIIINVVNSWDEKKKKQHYMELAIQHIK